ncbi:MAG: 3-deoxy-D-manno-octulosonic acid transferase, partial [Prevotellaceae bacterium]|nr:3-deoxy-D-manno-octulosonic acid transferase [Prevotellaceae bacterium]
MLLLYNIGIALYCLGLHLAAPFYPKVRQLVRGHRGALRQLRQAMRSCGSRKVVWFHCASLGEFEQGRPIIEKLREQQPEAFILLTFFSPSGYNVRKAYAGADYVSYLPLDLWWRARRFVRIASPSVAIFVKYEFWHHYFSTLKRQG